MSFDVKLYCLFRHFKRWVSKQISYVFSILNLNHQNFGPIEIENTNIVQIGQYSPCKQNKEVSKKIQLYFVWRYLILRYMVVHF